MSHLSERAEKNCLNCGTIVRGRYCHVCGQENIEPKESALHLIQHFFNDVTHFDGKFFSTLKILVFKPGFLSKEYMKGRRASYLNPIRMYLFTSFVFFLVFFSSYHMKENLQPFTLNGKSINQIKSLNDRDFNNFTKELNNGIPLTHAQFDHYADSVSHNSGFHFTSRHYSSKAEYDSFLAAGVKKHNWLEKKLIYKEIELNKKNGNDLAKVVRSIISSMMHHFPQMLFISLPFIALILKLLYVRKKQFYFVSHLIFVVHVYIFIFIALLLSIIISKLVNLTEWQWMGYLNTAISIIVFFYLYKSMRNFYEQSSMKTILKYFLFLFSFLITTIILFVIFFFISFFQI